jgi:hypothetical protein
MKYTFLKEIPELKGLSMSERRKLMRDAYEMDGRLRFLQLLNIGISQLCVYISILLTSPLYGHRTLLGSIPIAFAMMTPITLFLSGYHINPRIAKALSRNGSGDPLHLHDSP